METKEMIYYSIMNLGIFMIIGFPTSYLYFFLQDELHFTLNQDFFRYFLLSLGGIIGIIFAPIFGFLSDKTKSRYGRRRPWIMIFSPISAFLFWLISVPFFRQELQIQPGAIFMYIIVIFIIYSIVFNGMNVPYIALMPEIAPEDQRIQMSSFWNVIGGLGTGAIIILPAILLFIIDSYIFVCGILSLILVCCSLITFLKIKEPERPILKSNENNKKVSYTDILKDRQFLIYEIAQFVWNFAFIIILSSLTAFAVSVFEIKNEFEYGLMGILLLFILGGFIYIWTIKGDVWGKKKSILFCLFYLAAVFPFTIIFSLTPSSLIFIEFPGFFKFIIEFKMNSNIIPIQIQGIIWYLFLAVGLSGILILPFSLLMGIVKPDQEATYMGINATFISISSAVGNLFMALFTYSLGAKGAFYFIGPILGITLFISALIIKKLE
ncbi:MAG: MFS transporter [Candidatus Hodarchaeota archaeon]